MIKIIGAFVIKKEVNTYRCVECGKFISKEQFIKCARCEKCNGGEGEC